MVMLIQSVGNRLKQAVVGLPLRFQSPCAFNYLTKVNSNRNYTLPKIMNIPLYEQGSVWTDKNRLKVVH
jgi:hypothetical protein